MIKIVNINRKINQVNLKIFTPSIPWLVLIVTPLLGIHAFKALIHPESHATHQTSATLAKTKKAPQMRSLFV